MTTPTFLQFRESRTFLPEINEEYPESGIGNNTYGFSYVGSAFICHDVTVDSGWWLIAPDGSEAFSSDLLNLEKILFCILIEMEEI